MQSRVIPLDPRQPSLCAGRRAAVPRNISGRSMNSGTIWRVADRSRISASSPKPRTCVWARRGTSRSRPSTDAGSRPSVIALARPAQRRLVHSQFCFPRTLAYFSRTLIIGAYPIPARRPPGHGVRTASPIPSDQEIRFMSAELVPLSLIPPQPFPPSAHPRYRCLVPGPEPEHASRVSLRC